MVIAAEGARATRAALQQTQRSLMGLGNTVTQTGQTFQRFNAQGNALRGALSGIGKFLTGPAGLAIGAAAAGAALKSFVGNAINAADELGKTATRTGISVEAISSLQVAAEQGGTSLSALEAGLAGMSRRAVDAAAGSASAGRGFEALGISVTDANGSVKDGETLYGEVADALAMMEDGTQKSAIAQQVFGRSGKALIPVLNGGAAALDNNVTASTRLARSSEALNDRMDDLGRIAQTVGNTILSAVVPPLADLLQHVVDGARWLGEQFSPAWERVSGVLSNVGRIVLTVARHVGENLLGVLSSVGDLLRVIFRPAIEAATGALGGMGNITATLQGILQTAAVWFIRVTGAITGLTQRVIGGAAELANYGNILSSVLRGDFEGAARRVGEINQAWREAAGNADATRARTQAAVAAIRNAGTATAVVAQNLEVAGTNAGVTGTNLGRAATAAGRLAAATKETAAATERQRQATAAAETAAFTRRVRNIEAINDIDARAFLRTLALKRDEEARLNLERAAGDLERFNRQVSNIERTNEIREAGEQRYLARIRERNQAEAQFSSQVQESLTGLILGTTTWGSVLRDIGNKVLTGLINQITGPLANAIGSMFGNLTGGFQSLFSSVSSGIGGLISRLAGGVRGVVGSIGSAIGGIGKSIGGALGIGGAGAGLAVGNLGIGSGAAAIGAGGAASGAGAVAGIGAALGSGLLPAIGAGFLARGAANVLKGIFGSKGPEPTRQQAEAEAAKRDQVLRRSLERRLGISINSGTDVSALDLGELQDSALSRARSRGFLDRDERKDIRFQVEKDLESLRRLVPRLQFGGIVRNPTTALVGEAGPEAVVPLPGGRAIPVQFADGQRPGGNTVNVAITINQTGDRFTATASQDGGGSYSELEQRLTDWGLEQLQPGGLFADLGIA